MSNRCPDCNKFVSLETDAEEDSIEVDLDEVRAEVRVHLNCADCGTEMAETYMTAMLYLPDEIHDHLQEHEDADESYELEVVFDSVVVNDDFRSLKPVKPRKDGSLPRVPSRYQTHFYQAEIEATISCSCGELFPVTLFAEEAASAFDSLN